MVTIDPNDKMEDLAPADGIEWVTVRLRRRDDGGLQVSSPDLPGLILSGADASKVAGAIPAAIEALKAYPSPAPPASIQAVEGERERLPDTMPFAFFRGRIHQTREQIRRRVAANRSRWPLTPEDEHHLLDIDVLLEAVEGEGREIAATIDHLKGRVEDVAELEGNALNERDEARAALQTAEAERDKLAKALEKLRGYNIDIAAGRINYRPEDHIETIDAVLSASRPSTQGRG